MHEGLGFSAAGTLPEVGMKFGRWLDLTFMRLVLDEREPVLPQAVVTTQPDRPARFRLIPRDTVSP